MKTKSFKRVTSLILTFAMLLSLAPASFAVDDPIDVSDDVVVSDVSNVDQAVDNTVDADEPASEGEEVTPDVSSDEATENTSDDVDTPATEEQNTADNGISLVAAANTYYVANSAAGGSDKNGNGTETSPYMTIGKAIEAAANEDKINIVLMSDISATRRSRTLLKHRITVLPPTAVHSKHMLRWMTKMPLKQLLQPATLLAQLSSKL